MSSPDDSYDLAALSGAADVTPRTVRYYIQQGLLPSPGARGPYARYEEGHLERIRLIKRLQREHLPLAEIRRRMEAMDDDAVRAALAAAPSEPPPRSAALEYVRGVLSAGTASFAAAPDATRTWMNKPVSRSSERSQWERMTLAPDVELHVRRPLSREQNRTVERLLKCARRLFSENEP